MARALQDGTPPEAVDGMPAEGLRSFPLARLVPSAVSCGLCEPGLALAPCPSAPSPLGPGPPAAPGAGPPSLLAPHLGPTFFCGQQPDTRASARWALAEAGRTRAANNYGSRPQQDGGSQGEDQEDPEDPEEVAAAVAAAAAGQAERQLLASPGPGSPTGPGREVSLANGHPRVGGRWELEEQRDREIGARLQRMGDNFNELCRRRRREAWQQRGPLWGPFYHLISELLAAFQPHRGAPLPEPDPN
ncbi:bcl-2-binding component 3 [Tachyglossus aculeatus]|uniref:bcl-2-binding component 3 n=1 Tax=Tachyglossus aculeatus TaxID=9261 RepID=UPI0018F6919A|nr:bcl-2-binding component 3 [Tachyglossus aculeatus]